MFRDFVLSSAGIAVVCATSLCAAQAKKPSDAQFLEMMAEADMTTAHIGQMAEDRLTVSSEKDFARKLAADHTSDYSQVSELAAKEGARIPKAIEGADIREIERLDKEKGSVFERAFLAHETAEHERLIRAFRQEAEHGENAAIKAYANKALPVIEGHLHESQDLMKSKAHKA